MQITLPCWLRDTLRLASENLTGWPLVPRPVGQSRSFTGFLSVYQLVEQARPVCWVKPGSQTNQRCVLLPWQPQPLPHALSQIKPVFQHLRYLLGQLGWPSEGPEAERAER